MAGAIAHRGPDGQGTAPLPGDGIEGWFGHRRLRILDLSHAADQPMSTPEGGLLLTFNGEIYNFRELRRELESAGHCFRSSGDTEVVLLAYAQWGTGCVERLDGMFAFALWDAAGSRLLLARDRTGKKPLFYTLGDKRLTFASEIKAVVRAPWVQLEPALDQLPALLTFGCCSAPHTPYRGVWQLPPGHLATFEPDGGNFSVNRYWTVLPSGGIRPGDEFIGGLRGDVDAATRRRMVSDVPLGALLSGGIDSSVVVALMQRNTGEPVRTFSVGFPDETTYDERPHARAVARHLKTNHTEFAVQADAAALLDRLIWLHDGPFGDSSAIPTYLVCEAARQHVTVVLSGDGGDEVFAGYRRFVAAALSRGVPAAIVPLARALAGCVPVGDSYHDRGRQARRFAASLDRPLEGRYLGWLSIFDSDLTEALLGATDVADQAAAPFMGFVGEAASLPPVDRIVHANFCTYLPDDLHVKVDRMSMGHSLEVRSPLLDTAVIERMASVRARDKIGFRRPKPLLMRACGPLLPQSVWDRPKHGFGVPIDLWFDGRLGEIYSDEVLGADGQLQRILDGAVLSELYAAHRAGEARNGARLWTLVTMERWLRDCAQREPLREPSASVASGIEV
jgi:asparagine synthase (glutamine-hydrolysing)